MGHQLTNGGRDTRALLGLLALTAFLLAFSPQALADPFHSRAKSLDVEGLDHACGVAVDTKGNLYASSAGESKVKVYDSSHAEIGSIANANEPCGLAVDTNGNLYLSEKATGKVLRYHPTTFPFLGAPSYEAPTTVDASGNAKGIVVDPKDNRLYVAAGDHVAVYKADGSFSAVNEVQQLSVSDATGGTFKLSFEGSETAPIPYNASAAEVEAALEALATIGAGNVDVSKPASDYLVTFVGTLASTDVEELKADKTGLEGSGSQNISIFEQTKGINGNVGEGTLTEATGVAAYSFSSSGERYLWVADARGLLADRLYLFGGEAPASLKLRRELTGSTTPDGSFGFGAAGSYLAADPGNRDSEGKCVIVGEQACTAGHLFLYDAAHKALHEFDATGEYLDRTANAAFADAEPTAIAINRSGTVNDGTLYVTAGAGSGAKALAFGPLKAPARKVLKKPSEEAGGLSQELKGAQAVATDSRGNVYVVAETLIHVYDPKGKELLTAGKALIEDPKIPHDISVDSTGKVYVLDEGEIVNEEEITYYTPSKYPPESGTTYTRHEPPVATREEFPSGSKKPRAIAVIPGPSAFKDRLLATSTGSSSTRLYDSAANGSALLNGSFGSGLTSGVRQSLAVDGTRNIVYIATNPKLVFGFLLNETGTGAKERVSRFENTGASNGKSGANPYVAVDQASGHVITFDGATKTAREYDAAGSFVAEFGVFTEGITRPYRVAVDNSCAIHEPPLDETTTPTCKEFDPADRTAYVAFDDTSASHPPYDLNAFGGLSYPDPAKYELTVEKTGKGSGTVTSSPAGINCGLTCSAEFEETEVVTLTAKADAGSELEGWTGCEAEEEVSPTEGICEVTMSEAREVGAEFESTNPKKLMKVLVEGSGEVTSSPEGIECPSDCEEELGEGVKVLLKASAEKGSEIEGWTGCDSEPSATECEVEMTGDMEVKATFGVEHPLLTVVKQGSGSGILESEEPGIDCGSTCSAKFDLDEEVTLTANADPDSEFAGWGEGDCDAETVSPSEGTCEVAMSEPRQVTATFVALPQAIAKPAQPVLYSEATLRGEIDSVELQTKYHFEYLTQAEYEEGGESFAGAKSTLVGELAPAEGLLAVKAPITGLQEGTEYRFRLLADNSVGSAEDEGSFETLQRSVSSSCPNATYRFGLSANLPDCRAYELVTPGQTDGLTPFAASENGASAGTFSNWLTVQRGEAAGERLSYFTEGTLPGFEGNGRLDGYRAERGPGDHPPDGWQSALVSPDYLEAAPGPQDFPLQHGIAADQLYSFWENNPEPETFPQTLPHGIYLRTPAGFEAVGRGSLGTDLEALSRYLSAGGTHAIFSSKAHLEPEAPPAGNVALYDRAAGDSSANVLNVPPTSASTEEEAEFAAALRSKAQTSYQGQSEDGATVVFKTGLVLYVRLDNASTEKLTPSAAKVGNLLDCAAGPLIPGKERQFQWLRNTTPIPGASGGDIANADIANYSTTVADEGAALQCLTMVEEGGTGSVAVSAPVLIAPLEAGQAPHPPAQIAAPTPANPGVGTVETCNPGSWQDAESLAYQWYVDGEEIAGAIAQTYELQAADVPGTIQCVVAGSNAAATVARASGLTPTSPAPPEPAPVATAQAAPETAYAGTSEDGRYVYYAFGDGESPGRLFRYDTQSEESTEIVPSGIFALVSPDGSHALFSSTEALPGSGENDNGEEAEPGAHNLYAWDGAEARFVGMLSAADFAQKAFAGIVGMNFAAWTQAVKIGVGASRAMAPTRSTPDGDVFVFQSHARLTAYDNEGVGEIYRYDPAAEADERLLCVSCDPSGAPPSADALLEDLRPGAGASVIDRSTTIANLTDNGNEVFFQSSDRLLPEDANETEDVYEWQAKGTAGCTRSGGCLALISSGQGETLSVLYAMSADGRDVFFATKEKLVGADVAGSPSIYDARAGGGIPEPTPPAPCQGDACQGIGTEAPFIPSSATTGSGEAGAASPPRRCAKGKHRVKRRCVSVKKKHRHRKRRHRQAHANRGGNR